MHRAAIAHASARSLPSVARRSAETGISRSARSRSGPDFIPHGRTHPYSIILSALVLKTRTNDPEGALKDDALRSFDPAISFCDSVEDSLFQHRCYVVEDPPQWAELE